MSEKFYYVYILQCSDGSYYTGMTNDTASRVAQHKLGMHKGCYTYKRRPLELVYAAEFNDVWDAIAWEHRIKRWTRKKKEALIEGRYDALIQFSYNKYRQRIDVYRTEINKQMMATVLNAFIEA